jgi:hypothetical protein
LCVAQGPFDLHAGIHAASVHPGPGSNPQNKTIYGATLKNHEKWLRHLVASRFE